MPSEALLVRLRQRRRGDRAEVQAQDQIGRGTEVVESRNTLVAVLVNSPEFGHIWLARDRAMAAELHGEQIDQEAAGERTIPILVFEELPQLRDLHPELVRALLAARAVSPEWRLRIQ